MATEYIGAVVIADRRKRAKLEVGLIPDTHHVSSGEIRGHVEYVAALGAESLACSSNCEVCWDGH